MKKGVRYSTINEYIASQAAGVRVGLKQIRQTIKKAAPGAEESISYQMPVFKYHGLLVWFAATKTHYGFYPTSKAITVFKDKLKNYDISKGTIRFPLDKPLPLKLIALIVKYRVKENLEKEEMKKMAKK